MTTTMNHALVRLSLAGGMTLALLVGVASAANAKEVVVVAKPIANDVLTERVSYRDLNLASAAGVTTLNGRVRGAIGRVCVDFAEPYTKRACRDFAWSDAEPQIERAVTRAHDVAATGYSAIAPVAIRIAAPR